jgi:hypothetical protein
MAAVDSDRGRARLSNASHPGEDRAGSLEGLIRESNEEIGGADTSIGSVAGAAASLSHAGSHGSTRRRP